MHPRHNPYRQRPASPAPAVALAIGLVSALHAYAEDGPAFRFSGYGTAAAAHSSERNADFVSSNTQPSGAGHTRSWSFDPDTKLGVQIDAKLNAQFSGAAQALMRQQYDNSYRPELMMAFARWQPNASVALRVGRLPFPVFLISDYRNVGYSQTTLRAPMDMYEVFSAQHFDGADLTGTAQFGSANVQAKVFGGNGEVQLPRQTRVETRNVLGVSLQTEVGDLSVRGAYMATKVSLTNAALDNAFLAIRYGVPPGGLYPDSPALPGSPSLADRYQSKGVAVGYTSLSATYDPGNWFVTGEGAHIDEAGTSPAKKMGYLLGGMRLGAFTPFVSLSKLKMKDAAVTGHPILDGVLAATPIISRSTSSVGLRWDAAKNTALKAQYDRVKLGLGSQGPLTNVQPGFRAGGSYNVLSFSMDFVF